MNSRPTSWPGTQLVTQVLHSCFLQPGTIRSAYTLRPALPRSAASARSQPRPARRRATASIEGATEPPTKAYMAKRMAEGHSKLEAIRCLKRYIAREVFTLIGQRQKEINQARVTA